jgi:folate-binding protein YgfZ
MEDVTPEAARFAALLTPQGKILVDFLVVENRLQGCEGFLLDCPRALAVSLAERLSFYKLRAKVTIADISDRLAVLAAWNGAAPPDHPPLYRDPRHPRLGSRAIASPEVAARTAAELGAEMADASAYEEHRIALGIPRGGLDYSYGDAFPHEADMDQLGGVDFDKGCFVGQEVVSRMEHRGSARNRVVPVTYEGPAPEAGAPVEAGGRQVGIMGSGAAGRGLALLRLDRVADALAAGNALTAGGIAIRAVKPDWARFPWPGDMTTTAQ